MLTAELRPGREAFGPDREFPAEPEPAGLSRTAPEWLPGWDAKSAIAAITGCRMRLPDTEHASDLKFSRATRSAPHKPPRSGNRRAAASPGCDGKGGPFSVMQPDLDFFKQGE